VHICRKWRRIVFASQRALRLRLFCTHGTPVLNTINWWPPLPIVVEYGGSPTLDPPTPEDEDDIVAALEQSDRVSSVRLTVTNSLLAKLSAIEGPFSELEDLFLLSQDSLRGLTLPNAFGWGLGWGTRLRSLRLARITLFELPHLLHSSRKLVDLQLHEVLSPGLFSPETLTDALGGMAQLQSLSLYFPPTTDNIGVFIPSRKRVVLPSLTRLNLRGNLKYLDGIVTGIDAPRLGDIDVTLFDEDIFEFTLDVSALSKFVYGIERHKSHRQADILFSKRSVSVSLTQPAPTCFRLQVLCKFIGRQLFYISHICTEFSTFLSNVEDLRISATGPSTWNERLYYDQLWLEAINSFAGVKSFHVAGNLSTNIVRATQRKTILPALHNLYIPQPGPRHAPLRKAVVSFMISRRLSGHPLAVEYERLPTDELRREIGIMYAYCQH
jgi:hypothetical protein